MIVSFNNAHHLSYIFIHIDRHINILATSNIMTDHIEIVRPTKDDPFVISSREPMIFRCICSQGINRSLVTTLYLMSMIRKLDLGAVHEVLKQFGIGTDPRFLFGGDLDHIPRKRLFRYLIYQSAAITFDEETSFPDEFEKFYGFPRGDCTENIQSIIMKSFMPKEFQDFTYVNGENLSYLKPYYELVKQHVWGFETDKKKVFILLNTGKTLKRLVKVATSWLQELGINGILVVIDTDDEIMNPPKTGCRSLSAEAYRLFEEKISTLIKFED